MSKNVSSRLKILTDKSNDIFQMFRKLYLSKRSEYCLETNELHNLPLLYDDIGIDEFSKTNGT